MKLAKIEEAVGIAIKLMWTDQSSIDTQSPLCA